MGQGGRLLCPGCCFRTCIVPSYVITKADFKVSVTRWYIYTYIHTFLHTYIHLFIYLSPDKVKLPSILRLTLWAASRSSSIGSRVNAPLLTSARVLEHSGDRKGLLEENRVLKQSSISFRFQTIVLSVPSFLSPREAKGEVVIDGSCG